MRAEIGVCVVLVIEGDDRWFYKTNELLSHLKKHLRIDTDLRNADNDVVIKDHDVIEMFLMKAEMKGK